MKSCPPLVLSGRGWRACHPQRERCPRFLSPSCTRHRGGFSSPRHHHSDKAASAYWPSPSSSSVCLRHACRVPAPAALYRRFPALAGAVLPVPGRPLAPAPRPLGDAGAARAPRRPPLGLTWVLTRLGRKLRVTSNCTAAAAPCPATARRNPGLMVTSAAQSWGKAGRCDDYARRQCPGTGSLQDPRSARRPQDGKTLPFPAAATDVPVLRAPASSQEAPPPASSVVITPSVQSLLGVVVPTSP